MSARGQVYSHLKILLMKQYYTEKNIMSSICIGGIFGGIFCGQFLGQKIKQEKIDKIRKDF